MTFVSQASIDNGTVATYNLKKRVEAVKGCRSIGKKDMKYNNVMPKMKVDPETYVSAFVLERGKCPLLMHMNRSWRPMEWFARRSQLQSFH